MFVREGKGNLQRLKIRVFWRQTAKEEKTSFT